MKSLNKLFAVYIHRNKVNNKRYIGITSQSLKKRWNNGNGYKHNKYFSAAIEKYGWKNFEHIIVKQELNLHEAGKLEKKLISQYKTTDRQFGYNICNGGEVNMPSKGTKEKLSAYMKNSNRTVSKLGLQHSIETNKGRKRKENEIEVHYKKVFITELTTGKTKLFKSIKEAAVFYKKNRAAISKVCNKKAKYFISNGNKYSASFYGDYTNHEIIGVNLNNGETKVFPSIYSAEEFLKRKAYAKINECLIKKRSSTFGYAWFYKEDFNKEIASKLVKTHTEKEHKSIISIDLDENIKEYKNSIEAAKAIGHASSAGCIRKAAKTGKLSLGYFWKYKK